MTVKYQTNRNLSNCREALKIKRKCERLKCRKSERKCSLIFLNQLTSDRQNPYNEQALQKSIKLTIPCELIVLLHKCPEKR